MKLGPLLAVVHLALFGSVLARSRSDAAAGSVTTP
jgi:hypothetical protein